MARIMKFALCQIYAAVLNVTNSKSEEFWCDRVQILTGERAQARAIRIGHRDIKSRTKVMRGIKQFSRAAPTIARAELMRRIRKGQFTPDPSQPVVPS
jgi:transposase-like protein